jgi:hypothetical protein
MGTSLRGELSVFDTRRPALGLGGRPRRKPCRRIPPPQYHIAGKRPNRRPRRLSICLAFSIFFWPK